MNNSVRILIGLCLAGFLQTAAAVQCSSDANPRSSPIWTAFVNHVTQEYGGGKDVTVAEAPYAYGHALGRLASAVHGDDERRQAYECVQLAIDQTLGAVQFRGSMEFPEKAVILANQQRIASEAARGFHDVDVKVKFGVTAVSPLDSVFVAAINSTGRTTQAPNPAPQPTRSPGGNRFGQAPSSRTPAILSSTAPTNAGTNTMCDSGGRWSLQQALGAFTAAFNMSRRVTTDCTGNNWTNCRSIEDSLNIARDHLFQTADQNFDGVAECKLCNYGNIIKDASQLVSWQTWLQGNYYNASGLSNIYYTIQDMDRYPLCKIAPPILPPQPVHNDPPQPPRSADKFPPINSSTWVLAETRIDASGANSQCRHQPGKITWNRPGKGGAHITYSNPPSTLSPREKFKIQAGGRVNITKDHDRHPGFGVVVGGRHIGNAGTVVGMKRSNTPRGLSYSKSGERTFSAPSSFNAIDEFTVVVSDNWCPKVLFVYRKAGAASPIARGAPAAPVAPVASTAKFHWEICRYRDKFCRPSNACVATKTEMDAVIRRNSHTKVWKATGRKSGPC